ncbi:unnamed protein product, partial [Arabidopsis halleri]
AELITEEHLNQFLLPKTKKLLRFYSIPAKFRRRVDNSHDSHK